MKYVNIDTLLLSHHTRNSIVERERL